MILECSNLCKKIGNKEILKNISFNIEQGDLLGFIGPNGAGKTTTIKLILGLKKITSGSVKINGYDIEKEFVKAMENVGAIVENPDLYGYLSGYQNLKMISRLYENVDDKCIQEVVKLTGLENRIFDKVSKYSLGMKQRLGIAQAILHKPKLLILDEPTNGLDPEGIIGLKKILTEMVKEYNMAIMISSHNLLELDTFCNKVAIIKNGELIANSRMERIKRKTDNRLYRLEVSSSEKAKEVLKEVIEVIDEKQIKINTRKDNIPQIVEDLVKSGIKIYEISEIELSLEDVFLKEIGGNVID